MNSRSIVHITAREILDSRGNPTVEAVVKLAAGAVGRASVPSGASTGRAEAKECRDGERSRYDGLGVRRAVAHIRGPIARTLLGQDAGDSVTIDALLQGLDGTLDKSNLGANATLAVSLACAKAASSALGLPLYRFVGGTHCNRLPVPAMNLINGGSHANNNLDLQEFLILPLGAPNLHEAVRWGVEVYHALGRLLEGQGYSTAVGDEGGFAPSFPQEREALEWLLRAIRQAGYRPGVDIFLGLDAAASSWYQEGMYRLPKSGKVYTAQELIAHWEDLAQAYPILTLEDGLGETDWGGWRQLTGRLGGRLLLIGDDLFTTNPARLEQGIRQGCGNGILIKPNQIGTLTETLQTVRMAQGAGYTCMFSHRSGETMDSSIADLAVAWGGALLKAGAPARGERVAKYNQLLRLEEALGPNAIYSNDLAERARWGS